MRAIALIGSLVPPPPDSGPEVDIQSERGSELNFNWDYLVLSSDIWPNWTTSCQVVPFNRSGVRTGRHKAWQIETGYQQLLIFFSRWCVGCYIFTYFHSLYSFKSDGKRSGWWYASIKARTGGSVVTQTPDSIKNWKKFWFFVRGPWQFTVDDARPDLSIPDRYHELRYVAREPTEESSERARRARDISENLRSSAVLITEENLISARLSPSLSDRPVAHRPRGDMKDISALLRKKTQGQGLAGKGKRKVPAGDQDRSSRPRVEPELPPRPENSPTRSVEEITAPVTVRAGPSSSQATRPPVVPQLQPTYLGSTSEKDEEFLHLRGTLPKPVRDFIRSNSPTREEIVGLPLSTRRAIRSIAKAAIQLTSASEKMGRLLSDVQVMRDEGRKVLEELEDEKRL
ncbi:Uncharacterized protein Adt_08330 [Abeliophyllum distichum]|uniref:Uncharacterized protein n=1 Tax=Abeliophyllum distichum TaxID=126358 RepID=A0ABD1VCD8_9LAMI